VSFVDTSFWYAQAMRRDGRHAEAVVLSDAFASRALLTSNLVVGETWTLLRRRSTYAVAMNWLDRVVGSVGVKIERIDADLEDEAWAWLRTHDEREYSFVDATSFALMRKLRITDALAFDGDFAAAGFTELRA
jgi:predicted nucleic acid-binding protein